MANTSISGRRLVAGVLGAAAVLTPSVCAVGSQDPAPRFLADCDNVVETNGSFSMDCAPTVIPNLSDPLTEAEVSQPGWNAVPGGGGAGPHH